MDTPATAQINRGGTFWAVLELLRVPNLFTVPGDILVGWCLAGMRGNFPWLGILASLCLYIAGLLFNDAFDAKVDAQERPNRPIPSGRVRRGSVLLWGIGLSVLGLICAGQGLLMAAILLALILAYDGGFKKVPGLGVLTMGACRGANILLGVAVATPCEELWASIWGLPLIAAVFFLLYILLVSVVAKNEANPQARVKGLTLSLPFLMTVALLPLFAYLGRAPLWPVLPAAVLLIPRLTARKGIPALVSSLIRHLIPLQLLWCIIVLPTDAFWIPTSLLACLLAARLSSRLASGS